MSQTDDPSTNEICPACGGEIPTEVSGGICPKCALAGAAEPSSAGTLPMTGARFEPPTLEAIAAAFPQLEIVEMIGCGGMGAVYLARQPNLDRQVALKILSPALAASASFTERFSREGRLLARLSHPNIVGVHDFGESEGFFFLLMEYVDGVNLRQAMRAGRFTPEQALAVVPEICEALQYAHDEGVLHRDIKPENILLDDKGRVKIADFGIAKLVDEGAADAFSLTGTSMPGTPQYMAPEQIEHPGDVDHRADIFSLGVVFYEILTGELPMGRFAAPSEKTDVDSQIDEIVFRALEKERDRRQQTAGEMKTDLEGVSAEALAKTRHPKYGIPAGRESAPKFSGALRAAKIVFASIAVLVGFSIVTNLVVEADLIREAEWRASQDFATARKDSKMAQLEEEIAAFEVEKADHPFSSGQDEIQNEIDVRRKRLMIEEERLQKQSERYNQVRLAHDWNRSVIVAAVTLLTLAIAIPGTIMGWKSLRRIRVFGLNEKRRGALFAALFWPLAGLTGLVFLLTAGPMSQGPSWIGGLGLSIALVLSTALGWLAVKRTLRWLDTPPTESDRSRLLADESGQAGNPWWRRVVTLLACAFLFPLLAYGAALLGLRPGFIELAAVVALIVLIAGAINRSTRHRSVADDSGSQIHLVDAANPWPKRVFWLLLIIFVLPTALILLWSFPIWR